MKGDAWMAMTIVPCPDGGKCGSTNHRVGSLSYTYCLNKAIHASSKTSESSSGALPPPPLPNPLVEELGTNEIRLPEDDEPSVWIGSKRAYRDHKLVGRWVAAEDVSGVEPVDIFEGSDLAFDPEDFDDLWVYDTNNMPIDKEMSLEHVQQWADILEGVDGDMEVIDAYRDATGYTNPDDYENLEERYYGHHDSLEDYARYYVESTGLLEGVDETVARYFDYASYGEDIKHDLLVGESNNSPGVYIFSSY